MKLVEYEGKVKERGATLAQLKKAKADKEAILVGVKELNDAKASLGAIRDLVEIPRKLPLDRTQFEQMLKRRFFFTPSFGIYGGVSGLYDLGPPACAMKANSINLWRRHFIISESMHEVDTTSVTPMHVLK